MTPSAAARVRWLLLAVSCALVVLALSAVWRAGSPAAATAVAIALLPAVAAGGWVQRRTAMESAALQARVDSQAARIEQFDAAQALFVDSLAHEIRTPLTIIVNYSELLMRSSEGPAAMREHAKSLADYALHLSALFDGFLRLGGPLVAEDTSHHEPVHVNDLVIEVVRRAQSLARSGGVGIVATIGESGTEDVAPEVLGSEVLLEAMLESLVRHAVYRSPRGARVELDSQVHGDTFVLHVRDHGPAIATAKLASVFDSPFQPTSPTSTGHGGGLAIANRIAAHHRGKLLLRNHPDGGCDLEVALPRWRAAVLPSPGAVAPVGTPPIPRLA